MTASCSRHPWELTQHRDPWTGNKHWMLTVELGTGEEAVALRAARAWSCMDVSWQAGAPRYRVGGIPVEPAEMAAIAGGADALEVVLHGWRHPAARPFPWLTARALRRDELLGSRPGK
jgi:hypothetical protein